MLSPGIINDFLSAHIFKVLGRITYGIYLLHSIVQLYKNAAGKAPLTFSNMNVVSLVNILVIFLLLFIFKELETFLLKDFIVFYCMKIFDFTLSGVIWNRLLRVFFFHIFIHCMYIFPVSSHQTSNFCLQLHRYLLYFQQYIDCLDIICGDTIHVTYRVEQCKLYLSIFISNK